MVGTWRQIRGSPGVTILCGRSVKHVLTKEQSRGDGHATMHYLLLGVGPDATLFPSCSPAVVRIHCGSLLYSCVVSLGNDQSRILT